MSPHLHERAAWSVTRAHCARPEPRPIAAAMIVALTTLIVLLAPRTLSAQASTTTFLDASPLTITLKPDSADGAGGGGRSGGGGWKGTANVAVRNDTAAAIVSPRFEASVLGGDGKPALAGEAAIQAAGAGQVGAQSVEWFVLTATSPASASARSLEGFLLLRGGSGGVVAARPLKIAYQEPVPGVWVGPLDWLLGPRVDRPAHLIRWSAALAGGVILLRVALSWFGADRVHPLRPFYDGPSWDFKDSWTSITTTGAGILTAVAAASALPRDPTLMSKAQYAALALFFGFLVLIAPVVFMLFRRPMPKGSGAEFVSLVAVYLTACFGTFLGLFGQVLTAEAFTRELAEQRALPLIPVGVVAVLLLLAIGALLVRAFAMMGEALRLYTRVKKETANAAQAAPVEVTNWPTSIADPAPETARPCGTIKPQAVPEDTASEDERAEPRRRQPPLAVERPRNWPLL